MNLSELEAFAIDARRELIRSIKDKITYTLQENSPIRRSNPQAVADLEKVIKRDGEVAVVEQTAYTWFNRFCALRFMDVNGYTDAGVVTPLEGGTIPGILAEARDGNFDEELFATNIKQRVRDILTGATREADPNSAAYRALFIATCNSWYSKMPFLFEKLGDWTEILLPEDLLSQNSILAKVRNALNEETCADVTVIGWLYQFYISEKKAAIEEGFKRNIKASAENIPAVTQLFTPHWIVKYLVQNSIGRLWLALHPDSALKSIMEYYVPGDPEHPTPVPTGIERPEDIRVCDPCCGSAHMLIYAFDILYFIYEECGYSLADIPSLILKHNLYGLELDARAAALASFALIMKARSKYSRFLRNPMMPNICTLKAVEFADNEITDYFKATGLINADLSEDTLTPCQNLETHNVSGKLGKVAFHKLLATLHQFAQADNFGSLIVPKIDNVANWLSILEAKEFSGKLLLNAIHQKVLSVLRQAAYLTPRYHIVVTNPPYLGGKNMNISLKKFAEENYSMSKSDLFAMFIERCAKLCVQNGYVSMVTMQSWMFLSSYEDLRKWLLDEKTMIGLCHMGNMVMRIAFGTSSTIWQNCFVKGYRAGCCYVDYADLNESFEPSAFPPKNERNSKAKPMSQEVA